jgi:adenine-specific DNA-methyltransferase
MSRLTELINKTRAQDPELAAELEREYRTLAGRRSFGLNFERHQPEAVELPNRPVRKGDKVRVLPERGSTTRGDRRLWLVQRVEKVDGVRHVHLRPLVDDETEPAVVAADDLVVVAEFKDPIFPGLVPTGTVERGGAKPFHTVINAENFHALKALTFTHRGKVDAIYIDPPYNTGAKDWKYNNDYVEGDDLYRHSKWLAFMERRLLLAKELLNPENSVLIVTIDEKEYLRLGLLLEQTFPEARIQMVSAVINPKGAARSSAFARTDEYLYFVQFGAASPTPLALESEWKVAQDKRSLGLRWAELLRSGSNTRRSDRPNQFYPVFVKLGHDGPAFVSVGDPYYGHERGEITAPEGSVPVWPIRSDGSEGNWQISADALRQAISSGYARLGRWRSAETSISYLKRGEQAKVEGGLFPILSRKPDGSIVVDESSYSPAFVPGTQWRLPAHNAEQGGTNLLKGVVPDRKFPFPKSLYAVEDALRFFVKNTPGAVIVDFFSGSGTTAHAVMRLNRQDDGRRQCISVTNNEVSADEQRTLREAGLRPGDAGWEEHGICDFITKPRIRAAITGETPAGEPIKGDYKFTDEFPMAEGFEENAAFFTLTYESPVAIGHNRAFERIAPLLWMRAGSAGRQIEVVAEAGWDVADAYGVLFDLDGTEPFLDAVSSAEGVRLVFVVTDDDRRFQAVARLLPDGVESVRLYESYLTNFRFVGGV